MIAGGGGLTEKQQHEREQRPFSYSRARIRAILQSIVNILAIVLINKTRVYDSVNLCPAERALRCLLFHSDIAECSSLSRDMMRMVWSHCEGSDAERGGHQLLTEGQADTGAERGGVSRQERTHES
ncbi:hypothetical protein JOB18_026102 [Solea senegalensis]|uniref:Uncharacterized protein n=1 Tax=Solea senegalensis TaxID=28829 RepID=A0AAV6RYZ7_SOLSE|nr:hypothetical protein JOB18_026102 [Solea senegalensis]